MGRLYRMRCTAADALRRRRACRRFATSAFATQPTASRVAGQSGTMVGRRQDQPDRSTHRRPALLKLSGEPTRRVRFDLDARRRQRATSSNSPRSPHDAFPIASCPGRDADSPALIAIPMRPARALRRDRESASVSRLQAKQDGNAVTAVSGNVDLTLYGPADIIGIDPRLVVRTDPKPNITNFEPNYLAIVDFDPPGFPVVAHAGTRERTHHLRPWLVLVVVDHALVRPPALKPGRPLPSIKLTAAQVASELPDLTESWFWAHTQAVSEEQGDPSRLGRRAASSFPSATFPGSSARAGSSRARTTSPASFRQPTAGDYAASANRCNPRHSNDAWNHCATDGHRTAGLLLLGVLDRPGRRHRNAGATVANARAIRRR